MRHPKLRHQALVVSQPSRMCRAALQNHRGASFEEWVTVSGSSSVRRPVACPGACAGQARSDQEQHGSGSRSDNLQRVLQSRCCDVDTALPPADSLSGAPQVRRKISAAPLIQLTLQIQSQTLEVSYLQAAGAQRRQHEERS